MYNYFCDICAFLGFGCQGIAAPTCSEFSIIQKKTKTYPFKMTTTVNTLPTKLKTTQYVNT